MRLAVSGLLMSTVGAPSLIQATLPQFGAAGHDPHPCIGALD